MQFHVLMEGVSSVSASHDVCKIYQHKKIRETEITATEQEEELTSLR